MLSEATISAVEELLHRLRTEDHWEIAPDQLIAAHNVFIALIDDPSVSTPADIAPWIAPVVCSSPAEQREFYERMKTLRVQAAEVHERKPEVVRTLHASDTRRRLIAAATLFIVLALGLLAYSAWVTQVKKPELPVVTRAKKRVEPESPKILQPVTATNKDTVKPKVVPIVEPRRSPAWWRDQTMQLVAGATFTAFLFGTAAALLLLRLRRQYELTRVFQREGDVDQHYPHVGSRLFLPGEFRRTSQLLLRRRYANASEIDVRRSVAATARCGGYFTPVYATRGRLPEYVALIDRASTDDQQALLYEQFIEQLRNEDVLVDIYEFRRDPRVCWRKGKRRDAVHFSELAVRHGDDVVLVFSDATIFTDPLRRSVAGWLETFRTSFRAIALFTSRPPSQWDEREHIVADEGIHVLPASSGGLAAFAAVLDSEKPPSAEWEEPLPSLPPILTQQPTIWISNRRPESELIKELLLELEMTLGADGLRWLATCAIYPAVNWYVTLYLSAALRLPDIDRNLLALVRLPWFRRGTMPEWLRKELIWTLTRKEERQARAALRELFDKSIRAKRGVTTLRMVTFKDMHNSAPEGSPIRDYVLARFMEGYLPRRGELSLPAMFDSIATALHGRGVRREPFLALLAAYLPLISLWPAYAKQVSPAVRWHGRNGTMMSMMGAVWLGIVSSLYFGFLAAASEIVLFLFAALWLPLPVLGFFRARRGERLRVPIAASFADAMNETSRPIVGNDRSISLGYLLGIPALRFLGSRDPDLRWHSRNALGLFAAAMIAAFIAPPDWLWLIMAIYGALAIVASSNARRGRYFRVPALSIFAGRPPYAPVIARTPPTGAMWWAAVPLIFSSTITPSPSRIELTLSTWVVILLTLLFAAITDRIQAHRLGLFAAVTLLVVSFVVSKRGDVLPAMLSALNGSGTVLVVANGIALIPRLTSNRVSATKFSLIYVAWHLPGILHLAPPIHRDFITLGAVVVVSVSAIRVFYLPDTSAQPTLPSQHKERKFWLIMLTSAALAHVAARAATQGFYQLDKVINTSERINWPYQLVAVIILVVATAAFHRIDRVSRRIIAALIFVIALPICFVIGIFLFRFVLPFGIAMRAGMQLLVVTAIWAASCRFSSRYRATIVSVAQVALLYVPVTVAVSSFASAIAVAVATSIAAAVVMMIMMHSDTTMEEAPSNQTEPAQAVST